MVLNFCQSARLGLGSLHNSAIGGLKDTHPLQVPREPNIAQLSNTP